MAANCLQQISRKTLQGRCHIELKSVCAMTDLSQGLRAAGFNAGPERLHCLVQSLRATDFDCVEDLEGASRSGILHGTPRQLHICSPLLARLHGAAGFEEIPAEDLDFVERLTEMLETQQASLIALLCCAICASDSFCQGRDKLSKAASVREKSIDKRAVELVRKPLVMIDVANARPNQALSLLREALPQDASRRKQWIADARIAAVLGNCPHSHNSFVSGTHLLRISCPNLCALRVARSSKLVRLCRGLLWEQCLGLPTI